MSEVTDMLSDAVSVHAPGAWQRTTVSIFRPTFTPDGQGGSTATVASAPTLTVAADPVSQESGQTLLVDENAAVRVGDMVKIQRSQFRTYA